MVGVSGWDSALAGRGVTGVWGKEGDVAVLGIEEEEGRRDMLGRFAKLKERETVRKLTFHLSDGVRGEETSIGDWRSMAESMGFAKGSVPKKEFLLEVEVIEWVMVSGGRVRLLLRGGAANEVIDNAGDSGRVKEDMRGACMDCGRNFDVSCDSTLDCLWREAGTSLISIIDGLPTNTYDTTLAVSSLEFPFVCCVEILAVSTSIKDSS